MHRISRLQLGDGIALTLFIFGSQLSLTESSPSHSAPSCMSTARSVVVRKDILDHLLHSLLLQARRKANLFQQDSVLCWTLYGGTFVAV